MTNKYPEYKSLNLPQIASEILDWWEKEKIFEKSISSREGAEPFVFYEGPPSANGMPGIHHVMARTIKDLFCRYQTLKGRYVKRKAGWDTHGLPIEIAVEKSLGITKEDIGKKISVEDYNKACRKEVLKYQDKWEELTRMMGYWVNMKHPYITYENDYIESVWWLLKKLYEKKLLYKGYTIQPYSPAAGTGLSTHELNQPGCYRNVKDNTAVVMFRLSNPSEGGVNAKHTAAQKIFSFPPPSGGGGAVYFLAWTTTPWTLPSNTALAVGKEIEYVVVKTVNQYSKKEIVVILAEALYEKYFGDGKKLPEGKIIATFSGKDLEGIHYEQLLNFGSVSSPFGGEGGLPFRVVLGDFVTTEDGTGIVHIAPSFGADDFRVAKQNGIGSLTLVDKRGRFLPEVKDDVFLYGEEFVKEDYLSAEKKEKEFQKQKKILEANGKIKDLKEYLNVDKRIILKLQEEGKLFRKEIYEHSYPHCWRTDKPILYYPLDSWFVKVTEYKDKMIALNKTINWKPAHTGTGRFGEWLNNLQDWNLSRSRFWGIPLPIWRTASPGPSKGGETNAFEEICIGSIEELSKEIDKSVAKGFMKENPLKKKDFDLHKPYADEIILVSSQGEKMFREPDLIDVWFDSGTMPFAQFHFPFENINEFAKNYPADFIAEGVDQTRGWFYTLHAISALLKEEVQNELKKNGIEANDKKYPGLAYKNVVSNGLVLDKNGNKMSKRLGNAVDPFDTIPKFGADAVRWYMVTNADPWDNLKFDIEGVKEKQTGFFRALYNTYAFFALYANIDKFQIDEQNIVPVSKRSELDRWIISKLHSLVKSVSENLDNYNPTPAGRAIEEFVDEHLSNWYVRLSRRRFWKGEMTEDKKAAYETLYECLNVVGQLMSPIAPFFAEWLYKNLTDSIRKKAKKGNTPLAPESVHLTILTKAEEKVIDKNLEERMELAQKISSMILSIRKKENIRVRQPLTKIQIPILDESFRKKLELVKDLILSEVNVKEMEFVDESQTQIVKNLKLNFKTLGKKLGKNMKAYQEFAKEHSQEIISSVEKTGRYNLTINNTSYTLDAEDVEIIPVDIPGWKVVNQGALTVALDITLTPQLRDEGIAREIVNRLQNLRKEKNFEVTDRIEVRMKDHPKIKSAVLNNLDYIRAEILANRFEIVNEIDGNGVEIEVDEEITTTVAMDRITQLN